MHVFLEAQGAQQDKFLYIKNNDKPKHMARMLESSSFCKQTVQGFIRILC